MQCLTVKDYETLAQQHMEPAAWDYYAGGSCDEITLHANRTLFDRIRLRPRFLVDVSTCDTSTTLLGTPASFPVLVAPMGHHGLAHVEGECETARGVGKAQTIMVTAAAASRTIEDVAAAACGPLWFQLYVFDDSYVTVDVVQRAEQAGYKAIVLTIDVPRFGKRERDLRNGFQLPASANFTVEDVTRMKSSLTWKDIAWLQSLTSLPILLKGILTGEDTLLAVEHGIRGIIVSNHGGRQLDGAITSLEALPEVIEAANNYCEIYLDSGICRGTDIFKALALGADAVLVGRPILWGLAVGGKEGVYHVLEILREELELAMALCGTPTLQQITSAHIRW